MPSAQQPNNSWFDTTTHHDPWAERVNGSIRTVAGTRLTSTATEDVVSIQPATR